MSEKRGRSTRGLDKKEQQELVNIAKDMIKNKLTVRQASEKYGIPRATLHKRIHNHLKLIDEKLYQQLVTAMSERSKGGGAGKAKSEETKKPAKATKAEKSSKKGDEPKSALKSDKKKPAKTKKK